MPAFEQRLITRSNVDGKSTQLFDLDTLRPAL